ITVVYSLVEGLTSDDTEGNIDGSTQPGFINANAGDYRLHESSPAIDAGNNAFYQEGVYPDLTNVTTDVIGNPRFFEDSTVDMGAFEYSDFSPPLPTSIRYVKSTEHGGNPKANGLSWATASSDLQAMIDASKSGDEVWVAQGSYQHEYSFNMKDGVAVYGGFPAEGGDKAARDWRNHQTILRTSPESDRSVMFNHKIGCDAILDGFIVEGGHSASGGGISNEEASPTLRNLWIRNNSAHWGGGIFNNIHSSPEISDVTISDNAAEYSGGGIYNDDGSSPSLNRVTIRNNQVTADDPDENTGGAGVFHRGGVLNLTAVVIQNNSSTGHGGGIYLAENSFLQARRTMIINNGAEADGGGVYSAKESLEAKFVNTAIGDNKAQKGGGIYNDGAAVLINTTIGLNRAAAGGGIYNGQMGSVLTAQNSIISGNHKMTASDGDNVYFASGSVLQFASSLVTGSGGSGETWNTDYGEDGGGNIDGYADFLSDDSSSPDFIRLGACSPAVNAGNNDTYELGGDLENDLAAAGNTRLVGERIDMGAFERQLPPSNLVNAPTS